MQGRAAAAGGAMILIWMATVVVIYLRLFIAISSTHYMIFTRIV